MKMKNIYPLLAILLLPPSHATATDHETTKDGVIIRLKQKRPEDVQSIRLQVINEKIIHVSATPERTFSAKPSLISVFENIIPTLPSKKKKSQSFCLPDPCMHG